MIAEVRIGNFVRFSHLEGRIIDFKTGGMEIDCETIVCRVATEDIKPIPLTEYWLKRLGFELEIASTWSSGEERRFNVYRKNRFTYNQIQSCWWYFGIILDKQPEFVHQLQNLYFALTGNELKLN